MGGRRRFPLGRRKPRLSFWFLLAFAALVAYRLFQAGVSGSPAPLEQDATVTVRRVVDGDTLLLSDGQRVRLLGVDTPETKHPDRPVEPFGIEAYEFTRRQVEGRHVRLHFDRERQDRYHRLLAFVYIGDRLVNEELIRAGYSRAETQYPYSEAMKRRFRAAESEARRGRLGIWSSAEAKSQPASTVP